MLCKSPVSQEGAQGRLRRFRPNVAARSGLRGANCGCPSELEQTTDGRQVQGVRRDGLWGVHVTALVWADGLATAGSRGETPRRRRPLQRRHLRRSSFRGDRRSVRGNGHSGVIHLG